MYNLAEDIERKDNLLKSLLNTYDGESDRSYVRRMTDYYECHTSLALACIKVSGQSDFDLLDDEQVELLVENYSQVLQYLRIMEEHHES